MSHAADAGAKVVLVGDPQQLQSIEAGAAFRSIHERHGGAEIGEVRRQREDWQRNATRDLATGRTGEAIHAFDNHGMVHEAQALEDAPILSSLDQIRISVISSGHKYEIIGAAREPFADALRELILRS
ncbi:MAG: AAA family ATPase [Tropicimonas sp.]|uniref:AAA family ATPase n=1 Tax=Tropicimonas sp. TaxID=2067044 RepID=UPI003A84525B